LLQATFTHCGVTSLCFAELPPPSVIPTVAAMPLPALSSAELPVMNVEDDGCGILPFREQDSGRAILARDVAEDTRGRVEDADGKRAVARHEVLGDERLVDVCRNSTPMPTLRVTTFRSIVAPGAKKKESPAPAFSEITESRIVQPAPRAVRPLPACPAIADLTTAPDCENARIPTSIPPRAAQRY
jgi:hypothetical protein